MGKESWIGSRLAFGRVGVGILVFTSLFLRVDRPTTTLGIDIEERLLEGLLQRHCYLPTNEAGFPVCLYLDALLATHRPQRPQSKRPDEHEARSSSVPSSSSNPAVFWPWLGISLAFADRSCCDRINRL